MGWGSYHPPWLDTVAEVENMALELEQQFKPQKGQGTPSYPCGVSGEYLGLLAVSVSARLL